MSFDARVLAASAAEQGVPGLGGTPFGAQSRTGGCFRNGNFVSDWKCKFCLKEKPKHINFGRNSACSICNRTKTSCHGRDLTAEDQSVGPWTAPRLGQKNKMALIMEENQRLRQLAGQGPSPFTAVQPSGAASPFQPVVAGFSNVNPFVSMVTSDGQTTFNGAGNSAVVSAVQPAKEPRNRRRWGDNGKGGLREIYNRVRNILGAEHDAVSLLGKEMEAARESELGKLPPQDRHIVAKAELAAQTDRHNSAVAKHTELESHIKLLQEQLVQATAKVADEKARLDRVTAEHEAAVLALENDKATAAPVKTVLAEFPVWVQTAGPIGDAFLAIKDTDGEQAERKKRLEQVLMEEYEVLKKAHIAAAPPTENVGSTAEDIEMDIEEMAADCGGVSIEDFGKLDDGQRDRLRFIAKGVVTKLQTKRKGMVRQCLKSDAKIAVLEKSKDSD